MQKMVDINPEFKTTMGSIFYQVKWHKNSPYYYQKTKDLQAQKIRMPKKRTKEKKVKIRKEKSLFYKNIWNLLYFSISFPSRSTNE